MRGSPTWTDHVMVCKDCKREFRVSLEALKVMPLEDVAFCIECVIGEAFPGERPAPGDRNDKGNEGGAR